MLLDDQLLVANRDRAHSPATLSALEQRHALDVRRLREHVDRPHSDRGGSRPRRAARRSARASSGCRRRRRSAAAPASMIRRTTFCDSPARGGSTTSTSGRPARSTSSRSARRTSPAKKCALAISFRRALAIASATASRRSRAPTPPRPAARAAARSCRSRSTGRRRAPSRASRAYSIASAYSRSAISVLVWKNASGEMREAQPAELLLEPVRAGEQLGLAALGRLARRESSRVHSSPSSGSTAAASDSRSSSPSELVTRRTWSWPVRRPSRTTRLRSSPSPVRRSIRASAPARGTS